MLAIKAKYQEATWQADKVSLLSGENQYGVCTFNKEKKEKKRKEKLWEMKKSLHDHGRNTPSLVHNYRASMHLVAGRGLRHSYS